MRNALTLGRWALGLAGALTGASTATASSHMDAPLITLDDAANTTDVYAFLADRAGSKYLSTALAVYPFQEPGIGPNAYQFDDSVRYEIHLSLGDDLSTGRSTITYRFEFDTTFQNRATLLQSYTGVVQDVGDAAQNRLQTYTVTRIHHGGPGQPAEFSVLGSGMLPPNNQGIATPFYNQEDDGENPAKGGVATAAELDRYTEQSITVLERGHVAFAGQRDDGFYADIQAIFDLLSLRSGEENSFDSQGGFNVHTIALDIPVSELGGDLQAVGVHATTSRQRIRSIRENDDFDAGRWVQVGRQGNPLFCEGFVPIEDKDLYNRTSPERDAELFARYAEEPELAALINSFLFDGNEVALETDRTDLAAIFIPDLIRLDLSTEPARLAGGGADHPTNPDDDGFSRLGVFGPTPDVLFSQISDGFGGGLLPGGWPNGRRFGDDVLDIAVSALLSDLRDPANPILVPADGIDNVSSNDIAYHKVFPYAATPLNGRNHGHHAE